MTAGLSELKAEGVGDLICGHGSRNRLAVEEFARLAEGLRPRMGGLPVEHGYLEFAQPILRDSLDRLRAQGVQRVCWRCRPCCLLLVTPKTTSLQS